MLFIILIVIIVLLCTDYIFRNKVEGFDLLFTAYPKKFMCSDCLDRLSKHVQYTCEPIVARNTKTQVNKETY